MPRAKQRTPELRDRLLEVAIATLSEEGIARFTTRRVAERAGTSVPAVYELFDDKAGLVRAMFFEGFRLLGGELARVPLTADPVADLERLVPVFRLFCRAYPRLAQVMFSRPFADFEPGLEELAAGASVREVFVGRIQRGIDAGLVGGSERHGARIALNGLLVSPQVQVRGRGDFADAGDRPGDPDERLPGGVVVAFRAATLTGSPRASEVDHRSPDVADEGHTCIDRNAHLEPRPPGAALNRPLSAAPIPARPRGAGTVRTADTSNKEGHDLVADELVDHRLRHVARGSASRRCRTG